MVTDLDLANITLEEVKNNIRFFESVLKHSLYDIFKYLNTVDPSIKIESNPMVFAIINNSISIMVFRRIFYEKDLDVSKLYSLKINGY